MDDNEITTLRLGLALAALVVLSLPTCTCVMNAQDNAAMIAMVKAGQNSLAAHCAVKGSSNCTVASIPK